MSSGVSGLARVVVHPVVVLQILDQHARRRADQTRVFGTLLGEAGAAAGAASSAAASSSSSAAAAAAAAGVSTAPSAASGAAAAASSTADAASVISSATTSTQASAGASAGASVAALSATFEVSSSFPVQASVLGDSVSWARGDETAMYDTLLRSNPSEEFVGWYSTGEQVDAVSAIVHAYYKERSANIVHVHVVTDMKGGAVAVRAYVQSTLALGDDQPPVVHFVQVPCVVKAGPVEVFGLRAIRQLSGGAGIDAPAAPIATDIDGLERGLSQLLEQVADCKAYVQDVVAGKRPADPAIGRRLFDALSQLGRVNPVQLHSAFRDAVQDVLMVAYMANLTSSLASTLQTVA